MVHQALKFVLVLAVLGTVSGIGYYVLCLISTWSYLRFWHNRKLQAGNRPFTPAVSILKPLRGADPEIYDSFRSHCLQDYPEYELIFGISDAADPAAELVHQLMREFPARRIKLVVCPDVLGTNLKVSNLVQMLPQAAHDYLIVNDSDIRVQPDYLRRVLAPLADSTVGLVTCLYRGIPAATLGSRLEAVGISTDFSAGVLAARQIEGVRFGLGSTLAFPRRVLQAIDGFQPLADYLADDFELGSRIAQAGYQVLLSDVVVDHHLPNYSLKEFVQHQLRWARSTRDSRRWGYTGVVLTFGVPWALLALALAHGATWTWVMAGSAMAVRVAMGVAVALGVLRDRVALTNLWLLPLRDVTALLVWAGSYAGHTIAWRGHYFILDKGKLRPA